MWPFKKKIVEEEPKGIVIEDLDYDRDFKFLNTLISIEINKLRIQDSMTNSHTYTDDDCKNRALYAAKNIINSLSINYKETLYERYMTPESLMQFVVSLITQEIISIAYNKNKRIYN